jgi:hypothetical protein
MALLEMAIRGAPFLFYVTVADVVGLCTLNQVDP